MYSVTSGAGLWAVRQGDTFSWVAGAEGIRRADWFKLPGEAAHAAWLLKRKTPAVPARIVRISTKTPKRQAKRVVYSGGFYLALNPKKKGGAYIWMTYNVVGPDAALFDTDAEIDKVLRRLSDEGQGSINGQTPEVWIISV